MTQFDKRNLTMMMDFYEMTMANGYFASDDKDAKVAFDVYTGKNIAADKKSLAFRLTFQSKDRTLTDDEADTAFQNIVAAVEKSFAAELRA